MKFLARVARWYGARSFSTSVPVVPPRGSFAPAVPTTASPALRRAALEDLPTPRSLEEPFVERARGTASSFFFILIAGAVALIYAATREHSPAIDAKRMTAAAEALRAARVRARAALLAAVSASGSVAVGPGDGGQRLKWWASGPARAHTVVLFCAEDGESAAVWGSVHAELAARLAGSSVRVVSFHRAGALPRAPGVAAPLSLYLRDVDALLDALCNESRAEFAAERGWRAWLSPAASPSPPPRVVIVGSGESAWGALAAAGLRSAPAAPPASAVLVAPLLFYRGRSMAWLDAITGASRVPYEDDPGLLTRLLDAPNVDVSPSLREALDASAPRRKAMVSFFSDFGAPGATEAMRVRFSEDFRRARSGVSVLSTAEQSVVGACATALARAGGGRARVLTLGPQTHPSWVHESVRAGVQALWLVSALAAGVRRSPKRLVCARRPSNTRTSNRLYPPPPHTHTFSNCAQIFMGGDSSAPASARISALRKETEARIKEDAGYAAGSAPAAGASEASHTQSLFSRLPAALGLAPPRPVHETNSFSHLMRMAQSLPSAFSLSLLDPPVDGTEMDVVSIPLQRPSAVADAVIAMI